MDFFIGKDVQFVILVFILEGLDKIGRNKGNINIRWNNQRNSRDRIVYVYQIFDGWGEFLVEFLFCRLAEVVNYHFGGCAGTEFSDPVKKPIVGIGDRDTQNGLVYVF